MEKKYIAVFDSGIGGVSTLISLKNALPGENFIYLGDNLNSPYGNKPKRVVWSLLKENLCLLKQYPLKALVLGCNTLSVNFRDQAEDFLSVKTFGVYPPVEYSLTTYGETLLLSTNLTAERYKNIKGLTVIGFDELARDVEENAFNLCDVDFYYHLNNQTNRLDINSLKKSIKCVILGCTHYEFIKNKIFDHFNHQKIISGNFFTTKAMSSFIKNTKSLVNYKEKGILFIGNKASYNKNFYNKVGNSITKI